jgi:hypothetical protein
VHVSEALVNSPGSYPVIPHLTSWSKLGHDLGYK